MDTIRLFLVDDQILFVDMLTDIITHRAQDMQVAGTAYSGPDAMRKIAGIKPNIILLDVRMPDVDGISVLKEFRKKYPDIKIIMLTTFQDIEKARQAMKEGASGYLLKNMSVNDLIDKIRTIYKGNVIISASIAEKMFQQTEDNQQKSENKESGKKVEPPYLSVLSRREAEVYELLLQGYSNSEIAEKLFIARQTVKNHIYSIYSKIGSHDRAKIISGSRF